MGFTMWDALPDELNMVLKYLQNTYKNMEKTVDNAQECAYTEKGFQIKIRGKGGSKAMTKLRTCRTLIKESKCASRDIAG